MTRAEQRAALQAYQLSQLTPLLAKLSATNTLLSSAEAAVRTAANHASAARGLLAQRLHGQPSLRGTPAPKRAVQNPLAPERHSLRAAGVAYTVFRKRFEAPRQSFTGPSGAATVLFPAGGVAPRAGDRLLLLVYFDRNEGWRPFVRPPRRVGGRVGVFATRSPHRPSAVGLSACVVVSAAEGVVQVEGVDLLDETPVLGVRLYATGDWFPKARAGWVGDGMLVKALYYDDVPDGREVVVGAAAETRLEFVGAASGVDVRRVVVESLVRATGDSGVLAVGAFRVRWGLVEGRVVVSGVVSGMRASVCLQEGMCDPEARLHGRFREIFSGTGDRDWSGTDDMGEI